MGSLLSGGSIKEGGGGRNRDGTETRILLWRVYMLAAVGKRRTGVFLRGVKDCFKL